MTAHGCKQQWQRQQQQTHGNDSNGPNTLITITTNAFAVWDAAFVIYVDYVTAERTTKESDNRIELTAHWSGPINFNYEINFNFLSRSKIKMTIWSQIGIGIDSQSVSLRWSRSVGAMVNGHRAYNCIMFMCIMKQLLNRIESNVSKMIWSFSDSLEKSKCDERRQLEPKIVIMFNGMKRDLNRWRF